MFYQKAKFGILDEATSALDITLEDRCMKACQRRNISLLSIATRTSVQKYHKSKLHVDGDGTVATSPCPSYSAAGDAASSGITRFSVHRKNE